jgi:hypothetical protein
VPFPLTFLSIVPDRGTQSLWVMISRATPSKMHSFEFYHCTVSLQTKISFPYLRSFDRGQASDT